MTKSRRSFLKEIATVSVFASLPGVGFSNLASRTQVNYSTVLQVGGKNAKLVNLPAFSEALLLSRNYYEERELHSIGSENSSPELVVLRSQHNLSRIGEQNSFRNISEINPLATDQEVMQGSDYLIREIGELKTGIIGIELSGFDSDFYGKVDQVNSFALRLKNQFKCQRIFCMVRVSDHDDGKKLVERFAELTTELSQIFCSIGYDAEKSSQLKSIRTSNGGIVLLSLNHKNQSDISQICFKRGLIERFDTIELV